MRAHTGAFHPCPHTFEDFLLAHQLVTSRALRCRSSYLLGGLTHLTCDRLLGDGLLGSGLRLRRLVVRLHLDGQLRTRVFESGDIDDDLAALDCDNTQST